MRGTRHFAFVVLASGLVAVGAAFGQPTIPKQEALSAAVADLKKQIEMLYSPDPEVRGRAILALVPGVSAGVFWPRPGGPSVGVPGDNRGAAPPLARLLVSMLGDNADTGFHQMHRVAMPCPVGEVAAKALVRIGPPAVEPLVSALQDENADIRRLAALVLGRIGDPRAVEPLVSALQDENADMRRLAALALGRIGDPRVVESLTAALKDSAAQVRIQGAASLGQIKDARALDALATAIADEESRVQDAAVGALVNIGAPALLNLIDLLKHTDAGVRRRGARALGKIRDKAAAEPLAAALTDPSAEVRKAAAKALVPLADARVLDAAAAALADEEADVRVCAAAILRDHLFRGAERFDEPLIRALEDPCEEVADSAARALGRIGSARAVPPLVKALQDERPPVRRGAAWALGRISDKRAVQPLLATLQEDEHDYTRATAAWALGRIGDQRAVQPLLTTLQEDEHDYTRASAARALGELVAAEAVGPLAEALRDTRGWGACDEAAGALARIGKPAVEPLINALRYPEPVARAYAAKTLGQIRDPRAVEPLIGVLSDEGEGVRKQAADALMQITGQQFGMDADKWRAWWKPSDSDGSPP